MAYEEELISRVSEFTRSGKDHAVHSEVSFTLFQKWDGRALTR